MAIEIDAIPVVTYAMAHNGIQVINAVRVVNRGDELRGATLRAELRDSQGRLSKPFTELLDLPVEAALVLRDLTLALDPAAMATVEAHRPGRLKVEILDEDDWAVGSAEVDVIVHAAQHWSALPVGLGLEMLPAHVMPNSPEVAQVLRTASGILEARTGSPSIEGYQADAERVDDIVRAVYEALQGLGIAYANPPASWHGRVEDAGQKVRTPREVVGERVGTCLDLTVVMAACLEQAGIRPLLWVIEGHAFLGWWRDERALGSIVVTDASEVVNHLDLGHMGLVETTALTKRTEPVDFDHATRIPRQQHLADLSVIEGVVDVRQARLGRVYPLPAQGRAADGTPQIIEYSPAEHSTPVLIVTGGRAATRGAHQDSVPARVTTWKNSLLDLTLRNRLLNYKESTGINLAAPGESLGQVEDLLHAGKAIHLLPSDQLDDVMRARGIRYGRELPAEARAGLVATKQTVYTDVTSAAYLSRMRSLAYKAKTIVDETGANNLYLALGTLVWSVEGRAEPLRSPLILVPVRLVTGARQSTYRLEIDETGQSTPNYCLLEKLKQVHGMSIPGLENPVADDAGIDLGAAFTAVRVAVQERGLSYHVEDTADIAILQFAKFRLWKDLDEHWETFCDNALVSHLVHTPTAPFADSHDATGSPDLDALAALCPMPADGSQLRAVADAVSGRTFVLEGPPGTGKSQTITNLLARAMAEGKRVLFVAEKRAALDVVKRRLDGVGMGPYSLDLHDKGSKPAVVREQIRKAMDATPFADPQALKVAIEQHDSSAGRLSRYARRVHEENGAGLSLYRATTGLLHRADTEHSFEVPRTLLTHEATTERESLRAMLRTLPDVAGPARPGPNNPWAFVRVDELDAGPFAAVRQAAVEVDRAVERLAAVSALAGVLRTATRASELESLAALLRAPSITLDTLDRTRSQSWRADSVAVRQEVHAFVAASHPGLDRATPAALELALPDIYGRAQAAAASSWFGRKKRLRAVLAELQPGLRPGAVVQPKELVGLLAALVQLQGAVQFLAARTTAVAGVRVPPNWNPLTPEGAGVVAQQLDWLEWAGGVVAPEDSGGTFQGELRRLLESGLTPEAATIDAVAALAAALKQVFALTRATDDDVRQWLRGEGLVDRWVGTAALRSSLDDDLISLRRWLDLRRTVAALDRARMPAAAAALLDGSVEADDAPQAFEKGLAAASRAERLVSQNLDAFDVRSHERSLRQYVDSGRQVRGLLQQALPREVIARRDFNAMSESGRIGGLRREVNKTRRALPMRELMTQYGDLITQLMPCVLVSPDSLARFFPAESRMFDIVVFDEASQIRVADAIGAMGRASSVVVVGDSKQMPPSSFGEASASDDADSDVTASESLTDAESILSECLSAAVPQQWLSWHYRSQDESLIAFSNLHYYDGRLSSFPAPGLGVGGGHSDRGLSLVRVGGVFERSGKGKTLRTNRKEAEAIVEEIRRRFEASPEAVPSIGVVTFNQQQRAFIEALIRDGGDTRIIEALDSSQEEGLFIKNLENVQGDERDVILFSTAFSVNANGVLPLNFGPLSLEGGERRLNVAITRARRQVVLFTSFEPSQLRVEETKNVGVKHLRSYLEMADVGARALESARLRRRDHDLHREDIASALTERGYVVETDVGLSDFRVDLTVALAAEPTRPVAAVLLDGPEWSSRATIGDRDTLPVEVLGGMLKWPHVARIWLPAWLADREGVLDGFSESLDRALAANPVTVGVNGGASSGLHLPSQPVATAAAAMTVTAAPDAADAAPDDDVWSGVLGNSLQASLAGPVGADGLRGGQAFRPWVVGLLGSRDTLDQLDRSAAARNRVGLAVADAIATEGPIHRDRLVKLVAGAFDLARVNAKRADSILGVVPRGHRKGVEPAILWDLAVDPASWGGFRVDPAGTRPVDHVPLREIANAMRAVCSDSGGAERGELHRDVLAIFGFKRLTQGIEVRMDEALDHALREALLERRGTSYVAGQR